MKEKTDEEKFYKWLKKKKPKFKLYPWQEEAVKLIWSQGIRAGKTKLIMLLTEFDIALVTDPEL